MVVVALEPGATLVARLNAALTAAPAVEWFVVAHAEPDANELVSASAGYPVTVMGVTVADTCKEVLDGLVRRTVPREAVVDARGPWVLTREALAGALERIGGGAGQIRDLVALSKAAGLRVHVLTN